MSHQNNVNRVIKIPRAYAEILPLAVKLNANVLLHGFPGGIRHLPVDLGAALQRYGFIAENNTIRKAVGNGECFQGATLRDALRAAKKEHPCLEPLYRTTGRDPIDETEAYIRGAGFTLGAEEYLFGADVSDDESANRLTVSRIYRRAKGRPLDERTKWSQGGRFGDGYVAFKFDVTTSHDVYHPGAGSWYGQTVRGIKTTGKVRCTDPQRDGTTIEWNPPEKVCVSDVSYGDEFGMSNVSYFYRYYAHWRSHGKEVYFKGDLCDPPTFPCKVVNTTRPHNREFIGYTSATITDFPDYAKHRQAMSRANVERNKRTRDGNIEWPAYDEERVQELLCGDMDYHLTIPKKIDCARTIMDKARFPVTRKEYHDRAKAPTPARAFNGITASIMLFVFHKIKGQDEGPIEIDTLCYPHFANHQFTEEVLWGFEECGQKLDLERHGHYLRGTLTMEKKKEFLRLIEYQVACH
jgi:hypothetical protein